MPFRDGQLDMVLCCEVLEHLPFTNFFHALKEIRRVARYKVILSLPDKTRRFGLAICLFRFGWYVFEWNPTRGKCAKQPIKYIAGKHYWEIIRNNELGNIKKAGFEIEKQYRLFRHAWHRFFILRPK